MPSISAKDGNVNIQTSLGILTQNNNSAGISLFSDSSVPLVMPFDNSEPMRDVLLHVLYAFVHRRLGGGFISEKSTQAWGGRDSQESIPKEIAEMLKGAMMALRNCRWVSWDLV